MAAKQAAVAVIPKVPMAEAALALSQLCDAIDNGVALDAALMEVFSEAKLDLAQAVDRRIAFFGMLDAETDHARKARAAWDQKVQQLKAFSDQLRASTKAIIEAAPDLPYQGQLGRLALQKNGGVLPLALSFDDRVLTSETIDTHGIDERFYRMTVTYSLDTEAIRVALEAGEKLAWAMLGERGQHLRIKHVAPEARS